MIFFKSILVFSLLLSAAQFATVPCAQATEENVFLDEKTTSQLMKSALGSSNVDVESKEILLSIGKEGRLVFGGHDGAPEEVVEGPIYLSNKWCYKLSPFKEDTNENWVKMTIEDHLLEAPTSFICGITTTIGGFGGVFGKKVLLWGKYSWSTGFQISRSLGGGGDE